LGPHDIGARVTVRRRVQGELSDVVGDLEAFDDASVAVRTADGTLVAVPSPDVVAARVVGPSTRAAVDLEGVAARAWPAPDSHWLGRWWLRAAGGFTARANSVRPLGPPGVAADDALDAVREWYAARGLPPRVQVVVGSSLDRDLARRGWSAAPQVRVMTATLSLLASRLDGCDSSRVEVGDVASSDWLSLFRGGGAPPVAREILEGPDSVGLATLSDDEGAAVAIGRAVAEPPWLGLTAIEVAPHARRRGHGRAVMAGLSAWGRHHGAVRAYLEVLATNEPAIALYQSLGFVEHHRYTCREAP
jgi:ribosomal protein S18 acetylase RimI-like enzyme